MADVKISELTDADTLDGTEVVPVVQAGTTVKTTLSNVAALATAPAFADITGSPGDNTNLAAALAAKLDGADFILPIGIACSDESTALTTGTAKATFRMPFACTVNAVRASLATAQGSGSIFTVDINESGTTILSTKLTIDNTEKTSQTAAAAAVISDASIADDAEITVDIDQIGDGTAKGLKVWLLVTPA